MNLNYDHIESTLDSNNNSLNIEEPEQFIIWLGEESSIGDSNDPDFNIGKETGDSSKERLGFILGSNWH